MHRVLVLWLQPADLSPEKAADRLRADAARLAAHPDIHSAELVRLRRGSERHAGGWHWLLELRPTDASDPVRWVDEPPCDAWLDDLRRLRLSPIVLLARPDCTFAGGQA
jgi:hypothetical protein